MGKDMWRIRTIGDFELEVGSSKKVEKYSFMVPNLQSIDWNRIDREHYEDATERGSYSNDAFIVTSALMKDQVYLCVSTKFMKRFVEEDGITLLGMPFYSFFGFNGWRFDHGVEGNYYSHHVISQEQVGQAKKELAIIRKINLHHTSVTVTNV